MNPPFSPAEIAAVILAELLFGIGFNAFVVWEKEHTLWPTAVNVVIGTAVTVLIPTLAWSPIWETSLLLTVCFAASGLPMFIGSAKRKADESHKRRPWPTAAAQARDNAVMDLTILAEKIAKKKNTDAEAVNDIHRIIGTLKSV